MSVKRMVICGAAGIFILVSAFVSCTVDGELAGKNDQLEFSVGDDVVRHISDGDFIREASGAEGTGVTFYTSSDENVAMVNAVTGKVYVLSIGTAVITATNSGDCLHNAVSDSYKLTVLEDRFITTWKTDNVQENSSNDHQICIPTDNSYSYNYTIAWGDGTVETITSGNPPTHTYTTVGTYTVKIGGTFPRICFGVGDAGLRERTKILSIDSWGTIRWKTMQKAFTNCDNLVCNAVDAPDLSDVTDMSWMFADIELFDGNLNSWDVSGVTDMSHMFAGSGFNRDLNGWDVSGVTDMSYMFQHASWFNGDIRSWNVSSVTDMSYMFEDADMFNKDLNSWNVSNVTNMGYMFDDANNFNGDVSSWDVSSVMDMSHMFDHARHFNGDMDSWDVSNVTDMSYMFRWTYDGPVEGFNGNISSWDVSSVTTMYHMFDNAIQFNGDISGWDVSSVTNMGYMLDQCPSFTNHDLSGWDVSNVTYHDHFAGWGSGNTEPLWP